MRSVVLLMGMLSGIGTVDAPARGQADPAMGRVPSPVMWRLVQVSAASARPGQVFEAVVQAGVKAGWHLYALDEPEGGPPPLEFSVAEGAALHLVSVGADRPQQGAALGVAGSAAPVSFYEGQPRFRLRLRRDPPPHRDSTLGRDQGPPGGTGRGADGGAEALRVRYQACNDRMCLPPRTVTLPLRTAGAKGAGPSAAGPG